jgi:hypothetical protein
VKRLAQAIFRFDVVTAKCCGPPSSFVSLPLMTRGIAQSLELVGEAVCTRDGPNEYSFPVRIMLALAMRSPRCFAGRCRCGIYSIFDFDQPDQATIVFGD